MPLRLTLGVVLMVVAPRAAIAQTMRDAVKEHVKDNLQAPPNPPAPDPVPPKKKAVKPSGPVTGAKAGNPDATWSFSSDEATSPRIVSAVPKRPLSPWLQLDLKVDGAYRGWLPQQYKSADVKVGGYYTWSVELRGKLFKYVNLHRGYYESNSLAAPRTNEAAVAAQVGQHLPKAAWLLATVGVPISKAWEPTVRYESRAFNTSATPRIPVCIVDRGASGDLQDCPKTMNKLNIVSGFETFTMGVRYNHAKAGGPVIQDHASKIPPVFFGLGLMSYTKPYQVTINGNTLQDYLFDGRFRGAGLALGTNLGGGVRQLFVDADLQVGLGQVSLTNSLTLNELTPGDWLIGYAQGNVTCGYRFVLFEGPPTIFFTPVASGGGASFHFVKTKQNADEPQRTPNLNWDFLWSVRAAIEVAI
ncbi:MAG: hypothetical protein SF187_02700 [Deltaproteobacteria bacterium]|nr:hypothetical protein [Deltaproteobacteria bacterium]